MTNFYISNNAESLAAKLAQFKNTATVEAEYGDLVVPGTVHTLAHHGLRRENPCPGLHTNVLPNTIDAVGLSHIDLDAIGGCMAMIGMKPDVPEFWELAAFVDVYGPHKLGKSGASKETIRKLYAFWAYSQDNRIMPPRDGSVLNITNEVLQFSNTVVAILLGNAELLAAGDKFSAEEQQLNEDSFVSLSKGVIIRNSDKFTNHLYTSPNGTIAEAVVAYNSKNMSVTLSFADVPYGVSACDIVQSIWGPKAGGHAGIAGSPRDMKLILDDTLPVALAVCALLNK